MILNMTCRKCRRTAPPGTDGWKCLGDFDTAENVCPVCRTEEAQEAREEQRSKKFSDTPPKY